MSERTKLARDTFGFSLQGLRVTAPYTNFMAVGDDGINKAWDKRLSQAPKEAPRTPLHAADLPGRYWLLRRLWAK